MRPRVAPPIPRGVSVVAEEIKMTANSMKSVEDFLHLKRLAVVGVSRQPADFSRSLFRELAERNYDVVPVNPNTNEIEGRQCYSTVRDIQPPVEGALLMTDPAVTEAAMQDCDSAHIRHVWMFRGGGRGSVSESAVAYGKSHGIEMVVGECPFMFLSNSGWFHHFHGFVRKITRSYPN
jgi:predicted CoA-binding protein